MTTTTQRREATDMFITTPAASATAIAPDALSGIASTIVSEWGPRGYVITSITAGPSQSALAEVASPDGSTFWVGSSAWGNTVSADTEDDATALLSARAYVDREPHGLIPIPRRPQ